MPQSSHITVDYSHKPWGYDFFLSEALPMRWTGGPRGVIESLHFEDILSLKERYFPQFIRLLLYDSLGLQDSMFSVLRTGVKESLSVRESGQVNVFLKVLQEIRSGQVTKARAEQFPTSDERGVPGSVKSPKSPVRTFRDGDRPGGS